MALSKGKKVLIALGAIVISIGVVFGAIFGAKNAQEKVNISEGPGTSDSEDKNQGNQGQGEIEPEDPNQGETQDPENPDQGETQDPENPDQGETQDPEISEEEYRLENIELLKNILVNDFNEIYSPFAISNVNDIILNTGAGQIYFEADLHGHFGNLGEKIFTANIKGLESCDSQRGLNLFLKQSQNSGNNINFNMDFEKNYSTLRSQVSDATYDSFINYLKEQKYEGLDLTNISNENFFAATWFITDGNAHGNAYVEYKVINENSVYTIHAENVQPGGVGDGVIEAFMKYGNTIFKIVDAQPFEKFDLETPIIESSAQASVDLSLDFRGTTFDKDSIADIASAVASSYSEESTVHVVFKNQDGEEQRGVLVRGGKGGSGENKNTESDKINNMSMSL